MEILLKRIAKKPNYTIGKIFINGEYFCDSLEDTDRNLSQDMPVEDIERIKVYGNTAIPTGSYSIDMNTVSSKFKDRIWAKPYNGKIPRLLDVPGFNGVLIHPGNTNKDTLGCILVGENKVVGKVINSINTYKIFMSKLSNSNEPIKITVV